MTEWQRVLWGFGPTTLLCAIAMIAVWVASPRKSADPGGRVSRRPPDQA